MDKLILILDFLFVFYREASIGVLVAIVESSDYSLDRPLDSTSYEVVP